MTVAISKKQTLTFRTDTTKKLELDHIADSLDRDRSYILNQAIDAYLEVYNWQKEHIKKGLDEANKGEFVEESDWRGSFNKNR